MNGCSSIDQGRFSFCNLNPSGYVGERLSSWNVLPWPIVTSTNMWQMILQIPISLELLHARVRSPLGVRNFEAVVHGHHPGLLLGNMIFYIRTRVARSPICSSIYLLSIKSNYPSLPIYLSVCLSVCLSICLSVCLSSHLRNRWLRRSGCMALPHRNHVFAPIIRLFCILSRSRISHQPPSALVVTKIPGHTENGASKQATHKGSDATADSLEIPTKRAPTPFSAEFMNFAQPPQIKNL